MKLFRFLWPVLLIISSIWFAFPSAAYATLPQQDVPPSPTPVIPPEVEEILQTHFPGIIGVVVLIVLIIVAGALIKPKPGK